ncbi:MAG: class I SAM-dependent methyltransferase [Candidatus Micrarchaeales archaeon]
MVTNRTAVYDKNAELYKKTKGSLFHKTTNPVIHKILKKHNVKNVLDLTCGTGAQVFWLAKRGYKVVGSDLSSVSINVAKKMAKENKMKIRFLYGDMRNIKVGKFDAVISMFNAVGHLSKSDFEKAMRNVCRNLNDSGLYLFDIINAKSMELNHDVDNTTKINDLMIHKIQLCRIDGRTGVMTMDEVYCKWRDHKDLEVSKQVRWTMQTYTAEWLKDMLARNGFRVIGQYALDGSKFSKKKSKAILTLAQKC